MNKILQILGFASCATTEGAIVAIKPHANLAAAAGRCLAGPLRMAVAAALALSMFAPLPLGAAQAHDIEIAGVHVQGNASLAGTRLILNGAGPRSLWGFRIYVAALYLPEPTHDAAVALRQDQPRRLQITLLRDISTERNVNALKGGLIANNSRAELEAIDAEIEHFLELLRQASEVRKGTPIQLDYLPGTGTRVSLGNVPMGTIPGERFNRALMKIWLGDEPIQASLKQALLGQTAPSL